MTKREYFDLLVKTSAEDGFPAVDSHGSCAYRTENGKRCAAGLLIPDDLYKPTMENVPIDKLLYNETLKRSIVPTGMTVHNIKKCQDIHDRHARRGLDWNHEEFVKELNECVFDYNR